ncbi:hypothetical protein FRC03_000102 [Tulasnella sp. 419]|nr:hypothetical protein FRC03_000102 [Tulasnella sp. 419]
MVRFKNRWLLVEFLPYANGAVDQTIIPDITDKQVFNAVRASVVLNFGDSGWGAVGNSMSVKYYSPVTGMCVIRAAREHVRILWGALTLLTQIEGQMFIPRVVHSSGTIKKAQIAAIQHDRISVARLRAKVEGNTALTNPYQKYLQKRTELSDFSGITES